jgi:hypothetical protein
MFRKLVSRTRVTGKKSHRAIAREEDELEGLDERASGRGIQKKQNRCRRGSNPVMETNDE